MSELNKRLFHLDVVCGLLIIYMIAYHCSQWAHVTDCSIAHVGSRLFFFFMPWFFFKSGMFLNPNKETLAVIKTSCRRLVVPFLQYTLIGYFFYCVLQYVDDKVNLHTLFVEPIKNMAYMGACGCNLPLWFLLTLFVVRVATHFGAKDKVYLAILFITTGIGCFLLQYVGFERPYYLANFCSGTFFFILGFALKDVQYKKNFFYFSALLYFAMLIFHSAVDMFPNVLLAGEYFAWMVASIAGCVFFNNLFARVGGSCFNILAYIGKKSMFYYCVHWIILTIACIVIKVGKVDLDGMGLFVFYLGMVLFSFSILHLIRNCFAKWMANG